MTGMYKFCNGCGRKILLKNKCDKCTQSKRNERNHYMKNYYQDNKEIQSALTSKRWKQFRRLIIQRDKGICQRCLAQKNIFNNESLQVHHIKPRIKYPELMYDENNVITICKTCNLEIGTAETLDFDINANDQQDQEYTFHL